MTTTPIRTTSKADAHRAIAVMVLAFSADPVIRWIYPEPHVYLGHFPDFVRKFAGKAFDRESAYHLDGFTGAALWRPPGVEPDSKEIVAFLQRTVPKTLQNDVFTLFEQASHYRPDKPYWHLSLIGVDANQQGRGLGSKLIEHALIPCNRKEEFAYMTQSNPNMIPFYERYGFQVLDTLQVGSSPPLFPMLRKPR
uniref:Acetyltransferase (GNAT) domain-containing protein n=1 Tax=Candidatus Kentrum sp. LFY TaxID=2126342 RepID=A0A450WK05_9GAMM|nr:MAG: Acetyltransferase (GNAT) domain-containing protein [Candidatus Kentron sp. LFY]